MPLSALLLGGCTCGGPPEGVVDQCSGEVALPPSISTDILFVIDDSRSMQEEQAKVAAELSTFVGSLVSGPIHNDFQVGVVTTSLTQHARDCSPDTPPVLLDWPEESGRLQLGKDLDGQPLPQSTRRILASSEPDLVDQFALLVGQGVSGSGQEMGLEAMRRALSEPLVSIPPGASPSGNLGFLRDGAQLLVVIVSDEDDCSDPLGTSVVLEPTCGGPCNLDSECGGEGFYCVPDPSGSRRCQENRCETPEGRAHLPPVSDYVAFLRGLDDGAGRSREVFLAVIGALDPADPVVPARCTGGGTDAQGVAVRYSEAVRGMGDHGLLDSICRDDYADTLRQIAELVNAPQVLDLPDAPPDGRLLRVRVIRPDGDETACPLGEGFTFEPPAGSAPGRITLLGACRLHHGDRVKVELFCAG